MFSHACSTCKYIHDPGMLVSWLSLSPNVISPPRSGLNSLYSAAKERSQSWAPGSLITHCPRARLGLPTLPATAHGPVASPVKCEAVASHFTGEQPLLITYCPRSDCPRRSSLPGECQDGHSGIHRVTVTAHTHDCPRPLPTPATAHILPTVRRPR